LKKSITNFLKADKKG